MKHSNTLGITLTDFFANYLPNVRGLSPHTILNYRDSFKFLLLFLAQQKKQPVFKLDIEDIEVKDIIRFLEYLEKQRHNEIGTRNIRLSAIHSFFRYLGSMHPEHLNKSQRILNIPFKRGRGRTVEYLEFEELSVVLQAVDRSKKYGRRDYVLLSLMFNTGARVQEIVDVKATDLRLTNPFCVHLYGKGRKKRICPLWSQTAQILREYVEEQNIDLKGQVTIFKNHCGGTLTRFGVWYILGKYVRLASDRQPSLKKKRLHPHSMRHTTAVHLLRSGVDLSTISLWLGHSNINTTNKYLSIDLEIKRKALEKTRPFSDKNKNHASWKENTDILKWLKSL